MSIYVKAYDLEAKIINVPFVYNFNSMRNLSSLVSYSEVSHLLCKLSCLYLSV